MLRRLTGPRPTTHLMFGLAVLAATVLTFATPKTASAQKKITPKSLIGSSVSSPGSPKYGDVSEAIRRFTNKDPSGAQLYLETAKRKHPKLPPVSVMLAEMYRQAGNGAAMRAALEQSVAEAADDPEPYLMLAEQALAGNRTIEADALFDRAVVLIDSFDSNAKRKRSFQIRAYRGRAAVAQRRSKWEQAESDLRSWLEVDPENAAAHRFLGTVLLTLERSSDGLKALAEAKRLDDNEANPYVTAGAVLLRSGDTDEALKYFKRAYKDDDSQASNITQLANALLIAGDLSNADKVLERGREKLPNEFNLLLLSGAAARMQGDDEQAERYLGQALAMNPTNRDTILQLTYILNARGDDASTQRARQYAALNARLNDKHPDAQVALAWTFEQGGQTQQATSVLSKMTQTSLLSPEGKLVVAKMLLNRNRQEGAKQMLTSALAQKAIIFIGRDEAEAMLAKL